jgi:FG-GAP-like repeat
VAVGDFDGDGKLDLAVARGGFDPGPVSVFLGRGDGTFQAAGNYAVGFPGSMTVGDFNSDGCHKLRGRRLSPVRDGGRF